MNKTGQETNTLARERRGMERTHRGRGGTRLLRSPTILIRATRHSTGAGPNQACAHLVPKRGRSCRCGRGRCNLPWCSAGLCSRTRPSAPHLVGQPLATVTSTQGVGGLISKNHRSMTQRLKSLNRSARRSARPMLANLQCELRLDQFAEWFDIGIRGIARDAVVVKDPIAMGVQAHFVV